MKLVGDVVDIPRDPTAANVMPLIFSGLALVFGIATVFFDGGPPSAIMTGALLAGALGIRVKLMHSLRLVFTTRGIWRPGGPSNGTFYHWGEIQEVRAHRGVLVLRGGSETLEIRYNTFKDPFALNRLVRTYVPHAISGHLESEGEV